MEIPGRGCEMSQMGRIINDSAPIDTITGDSGGAVGPDGAGNLNLTGGTLITTVGTPAANDITINLDNGTDGQVIIASTAGSPAYANITSSGGSLTVSNGSNTIDLSITAPVSVANGGTGATTLTDHGVLVGSGTAAVTPLAVGTNGQVLVGSTGADPVFATITSSDGSITVTGGAGSLDLTTGPRVYSITALDNTDTPYVVLAADEYMSCDMSLGVLQINLPNAPSTGRVYTIKDSSGDAGTSNITVTTVGGVVTIDGSTSVTMNTNYQSIRVIFNGTSYEIF